MNEYCFDEIPIGHVETFCVTVTQEMMAAFRDLTGDVNPLHTDLDFAQKYGGRKQCVNYGMLTAAFLSTLAGVYLPGKYSLIHSMKLEFPVAVFPGETLTVSGMVKEKDERFRTIRLAVTIRNGEGKKVLRGEMSVGVMK